MCYYVNKPGMNIFQNSFRFQTSYYSAHSVCDVFKQATTRLIQFVMYTKFKLLKISSTTTPLRLARLINKLSLNILLKLVKLENNLEQ